MSPAASCCSAWSVPEGLVEHAAGVYARRYATTETTAGMAAAAARQALANAGIPLQEIDAIVGASTVPQQAIPCTAAFVQRELGAPDGGSVCFDVNATCLSFLVALQNAAHLVAAGAYRNVLIFSSELGSRFLNPRQPQSAILFGDAAAAAVVTRAGLLRDQRHPPHPLCHLQQRRRLHPGAAAAARATAPTTPPRRPR